MIIFVEVCEVFCLCEQPLTILQLKAEIRRVMGQIQAELCTSVVHKMDVCRRSRGGHLPDILFHV